MFGAHHKRDHYTEVWDGATWLEEQAAIELGQILESLPAMDIENFSDRVFDFIPILISQASRPTTTGLNHLVERAKFWGKKLLVRRGAAAAMPGSDGLEVFTESGRALLAAFEKHAPGIQKIFVEQVKRCPSGALQFKVETSKG